MVANVCSWWGSRLGASAAIAASSTPPRRGVCAAGPAPGITAIRTPIEITAVRTAPCLRRLLIVCSPPCARGVVVRPRRPSALALGRFLRLAAPAVARHDRLRGRPAVGPSLAGRPAERDDRRALDVVGNAEDLVDARLAAAVQGREHRSEPEGPRR